MDISKIKPGQLIIILRTPRTSRVEDIVIKTARVVKIKRKYVELSDRSVIAFEHETPFGLHKLTNKGLTINSYHYYTSVMDLALDVNKHQIEHYIKFQTTHNNLEEVLYTSRLKLPAEGLIKIIEPVYNRVSDLIYMGEGIKTPRLTQLLKKPPYESED